MGRLFCHISGKKSIIRSFLTGAMSMRQLLSLLKSTSDKQYCYGPKPYEFDASSVEAPPYLYVHNVSGAQDGANDFEQIMQCFDISVLSHERFVSEKRAENAPAVEASASAQDRPMSPVASSSPSELFEKLRVAKDDLMHRITSPKNTESSSPSSAAMDRSFSPGK